MATGSPLYLTTYTESSGSPLPFLDFRLDLDGTSASSNMNKIDVWAGEVSGSISDIIEGLIIPVSAYSLTGGVYYCETDSINELYDGLIISLTLDKKFVGQIYLTINGRPWIPVISPRNAFLPNAVYLIKYKENINPELLGELYEISPIGGESLYIPGNDGEIVISTTPTFYTLGTSGSTLSFNSDLKSDISSGSFISFTTDTPEQGTLYNIQGGSSIVLSTLRSASTVSVDWSYLPTKEGKAYREVIGSLEIADNTIDFENISDGGVLSYNFSASAITPNKIIDRNKTIFVPVISGSTSEYAQLDSSGCGLLFPDGEKRFAYGWFYAPPDVAEQFVISPLIIAPQTGTYVLGIEGYYGQSGSAIVYNQRAISTANTIVTGCPVFCPAALTPESSACAVKITFVRDGTSIDDTANGSLYLFGINVLYTADS